MPLLRRQVLVAQTTGQPIYVALPATDHPRADTIRDLAVDLLAVPDCTAGMSATMRGAIAQMPPCAAFMVLLGDLVAITGDDLLKVIMARQQNPDYLIWRGATIDGKPGHPIIFDASLRQAFATLSGDQGGEPVVKAHVSATFLVPLPDQRARLDLDTPEDWANWRKSAL